MSQNDFIIDNDTALAVRLDLQGAFQALASNNSGDTAPTTTYANMFWYDSSSNQIKMRNSGDSAWVTLGELNGSSFEPYVGAFKITNLSATKIGFESGGTTRMSLDTSGNLKAAGNITAYTTP